MNNFFPSQADLIAAIATPPGSGGIAVIRMSGANAEACLRKVFKPAKAGVKSTFSFIPRHMHFGYALDSSGQRCDEVLAVCMPGPHSATGEDTAEIHCHGGQAVVNTILEAVLAAGARLALPGEFTKRAYLNGRIDLAQAEAVAELIAAPTRQGLRLAEAKLEGALSARIQELRNSLDSLRIQMTVAVDFPDDEPEILPKDSILGLVSSALADIRSLIEAYNRASLWREGACAVLAGQVNAGKSSLLNALLGRERAIVSSLPGTTRDYIEETLNIQGFPLRLIDTAGLRTGGDIVEEEGIKRSHNLAEQADIILLVVDAGQGICSVEEQFLQRHEEKLIQGKILLVLNKSDTLEGPITYSSPHLPQFLVSARKGTGLDTLSAGIAKALGALGQDSTSDIAPNRRQCDLLRKAGKELALLEQDINAGMPADILAIRVDHAVACLDEVTGTTPDETLLDIIFSSFCIGK